MSVRTPDFRRVYFIGAGFTACQGYPLGGQLVKSLLVWLEEQSNVHESESYRTKASSIRKRVLHVLQDFLRQSVDRVDVSEFYTLVQMMSETPAVFGSPEGGDMAGLYDSLSAATAELLLATCQDKLLASLPAAILNHMDPLHHAIVNFNWDEEVDSHLTTEEDCAGDDISYTLGSWENDRSAEKPYLLLKPHGSAGWFDVAEGISNREAYFICEYDPRITRRSRRIMAYYEIESPKTIGGGEGIDCPRVMTPPTFAKRFDYREQQFVWQDVIQVCSGAREFVFLGYNLRPDDYLTRAAIRNALRVAQCDDVKCLVVDRGSDERSRAALLANFQSVFGETLDEKRNFLFGDFGHANSFPDVRTPGKRGDKAVLRLMDDTLRKATLSAC